VFGRVEPDRGLGHQEVGLEAAAGPLHSNDRNMLEIGDRGVGKNEQRTHMSLWSMFAAPPARPRRAFAFGKFTWPTSAV